ncbi:MAG: VOC family protein [Nocardioidaceae bacterium]
MASRIGNTCIDCADPYLLAQFWSIALDRPMGPDDRPEADEAGIALDDDGGELLFLRVPEPKAVKNRMHLCLIPEQPRDAELARLVDAGASLVNDLRQDDGTGWVVLGDPEGNEFCVLRSDAERAVTQNAE